jgi:VWFA-related protein
MKIAAALIAVSLALEQSTAKQFRSGVEVVTVDALVTQGDRAVSGLRATDFELRDSGIVQEIDTVSVDDVPVSMLLALDTSNSVEGPILRHLKDAAIGAVDSLTKDDRAAILTFADAVTLRADWGPPSPATRNAIAEAMSGGSTSLYDAGYAALTLKDDLPGRRSFVVLFSDGGDNSSWLPARALLERARRSDAVVYVVTLHPPRRDVRLEFRSGIELWRTDNGFRPGTPAILEVANITGGHILITERADQLRDAFSAIVTQFRSRYFITYRPRGVDAAGWHPIDLKLKKRQATIKARRGYSR